MLAPCECSVKLELSRARTPRALSICRILYRDRPIMLTISTSPLVGRVDGCGYDGRQKDAICDVRGPCLTIRGTFKPVCRWFRLIGHAYKLLRCLDVEIWRFSWWQQTDGQTDEQTDRLLYPCACVRGNKFYSITTGNQGKSRGWVTINGGGVWGLFCEPIVRVHTYILVLVISS